MIRSIIILPHMRTFAYYKHSARWWHLSSHMLGYTSMIMVSTLMIRAIYFKWVIIGGRLPWRWRWGLWQIYCRVGIGWRWWAAEVCHHCVLALPARVSPPHRRFTSLSFASIYESRVRSSQVLPFRCTTALLGILKDDSWKRIGYTKSVLFFFSFPPFYFFLLNYEEFMVAIWSGVSLSAELLFCMFQI